MRTLVIGGTGKVGSAVVEQLLRRGSDVRVLARKQPSSIAEGVEVAIGDLLDPTSVQAAFQGIDKLFLLNGVAVDELTQALIALDVAKASKLKQLTYLSVFQAQKFPDVPHFASKFAVEAQLKQSGVPYTILRPNYFFQNDGSLKDALLGGGVYPMPLGSRGVSAVDVRDIAEAAAISLTSDGHAGKTYSLVGPAAVSGLKAAEIWAEVLGKPVLYTGEALAPFEENLRTFLPAWMAFDMRIMFQGYLERGFVAGPGDVETSTTLLGHAPRSYKAFARETAAGWR